MREKSGAVVKRLERVAAAFVLRECVLRPNAVSNSTGKRTFNVLAQVFSIPLEKRVEHRFIVW
jgi:hypothetical protein